MKFIILEKKESFLEGFHPNGIEVGDVSIRGFVKENPKVGTQFILYNSEEKVCAWTSEVEEYKHPYIKTKNSLYIIKNEEDSYKCNNCQSIFTKSIVVNEEHSCPFCLSNDIKL